jgi:hypothetical protein
MLPLRRRIVRWVADNLHLLKHKPQMPPELHDRAADNSGRPSIALATFAQPARRDQFLAVFDWVLEEIRHQQLPTVQT